MLGAVRLTIKSSISNYCVDEHETLKDALNKISNNEDGIVFCLDQDNVVQGVLSDGDIRRWIVKKDSISLNSDINEAINKNFYFLYNSSLC
tara:strand:+ start:255 stop:527 length:273 start_codon:yes stop_codon:yes gene_type:complete